MTKDKRYKKIWTHEDFSIVMKREAANRGMSVIDFSKQLADDGLSTRPVHKEVRPFEKFKFTK